MKPLPSQSELCELFSYDPITGFLIHKKTNWVGRRAGSFGKKYRVIRVNSKYYYEHRIIWKMATGKDPGEIDHKNRTKFDNSWENLREATKSQNLANTAAYANSKTGIKGVTPQAGQFLVRVKKNGVMHYVGYFRNEDAAQAAYEAKLKELFGEFARVA